MTKKKAKNCDRVITRSPTRREIHPDNLKKTGRKPTLLEILQV